MPKNASEIGKRRVYTFRGTKYPSVTTLLRGYPQEWAIAYGAKSVAERAVFQFSELAQRLDDEPIDWTLKWLKAASYEKRDAAADAGTARHGYLEDRLNGLGVPDDLSPAEVAIEQFLAVYRPEPLYVEPQVYSVTEGYAGSADAFVTIYGKRYLIDLKTASTYDPMNPKQGKAGGDHKDRLQLAAYRYADFIGEDDRELAPVPTVDACAVLSIPRDHPQAWRLIEVKAGRDEHLMFLTFAKAWQWYDANKDEPIGEQVLAQTEEVA